MTKKVSVAILGSTGFVGLELVKILSEHPKVNIVYFGTENVRRKNKVRISENKL